MTAPTREQAHEMGAKGSPPVEAERLAFEAWMKGHCWSLCATWRGTQYQSDSEVGGHLDPFAMRTRELWAAWRDRAALAGQSAPSGSGAELVLAMENTKNDAERAALWPRLRAALLAGDAAREDAERWRELVPVMCKHPDVLGWFVGPLLGTGDDFVVAFDRARGGGDA